MHQYETTHKLNPSNHRGHERITQFLNMNIMEDKWDPSLSEKKGHVQCGTQNEKDISSH